MRGLLPRAVRLVSLYVFVVMAFGFGILVSSVGRWGDWGVGIGAVILLFGSVYGVTLFTYVGWRACRVKKVKAAKFTKSETRKEQGVGKEQEVGSLFTTGTQRWSVDRSPEWGEMREPRGEALGRGFQQNAKALKGRNNHRHLALSGLSTQTSSASQGALPCPGLSHRALSGQTRKSARGMDAKGWRRRERRKGKAKRGRESFYYGNAEVVRGSKPRMGRNARAQGPPRCTG